MQMLSSIEDWAFLYCSLQDWDASQSYALLLLSVRCGSVCFWEVLLGQDHTETPICRLATSIAGFPKLSIAELVVMVLLVHCQG
jgi:hypothetical protein